MHDKPVALVTGANKGIGLQIAKDLAHERFTVLLGSRRQEAAEAVAKSVASDARAVQLDVTDAVSIAAAAKLIGATYGRLDVLVNNAGINRSPEGGELTVDELMRRGRPSLASIEEVRFIFETNVFGVIAVTQAMLPLLREAPAGRIVNVSSNVGSLTTISDPAYPFRGMTGIGYGPSKSALNAVTVAFAQELAETSIKVNAACPGYTATDHTNNTGARGVIDAAREPVRLALIGADGPTGTFSNEDGPLPW